MQNEQLQNIWKEWKNVILVTVAVVVTMTSMWWLPPILPMFGIAPGQVESTTNQVMNMMWWVVFFLAAQSIFGNRKKRQEAKKSRGSRRSGRGRPQARSKPRLRMSRPGNC